MKVFFFMTFFLVVEGLLALDAFNKTQGITQRVFSASAEEAAALADNLAKIADTIKNSVARFKI